MDGKNSSDFPNFPLAELHAHLASSINPSVYWQIAHDSGFKLPKKDFHDFLDYVTLSPKKQMTMHKYFDEIYHPLLDKLSSGVQALEKATYEIMNGAYRGGIDVLELRFDPMKHNREGEQDLDHIILAMLRGMERAFLEYPGLSAGLIFCMDRQFTYEKNEIILQKAIKYKNRGVVAIDVANYDTGMFKMKDYKGIFEKAKKAGLKITIHSGETPDTNDMWEVLEFAKPQRIGHGIKAAHDKSLMKEIVKQDIVMEICPLSNIMTKAVENMDEMKFILRTFIENKVKFTINTDWPEMIENAHLWRQFVVLRDEGILSEEELIKCNQIAHSATFAKIGGLDAYL